MNSSIRSKAFAIGVIAALLGTGAARAADDQPIQAQWKLQEIRYSYMGFTSAYDCDGFEDKLKRILRVVGAHPRSKIVATGCEFNRPSRNFFVTITAATPVPASEVLPTTTAEQSKQELLKRLGVKNDFSGDEFPAAWKTVNLSKDRKLDLDPGDCEFMDDLKDTVFPKLGVRIVEENIQCTPNQVGITTPKLTVSALVAVDNADKAIEKR